MTEGSDKVVKVKAGSFATMGLDKFLFQGLTRMQYKAPTPIQRKALPVALAGMDVVCMARTGSGKTAVFLIPLVQKLKKHKPEFGVRGLLLAPSRELALQTFKFAVDMAKFTDLRIISIVGGDGIEAQFDMLSHSPDIISKSNRSVAVGGLWVAVSDDENCLSCASYEAWCL
jgi:ATP-dependent RNA helicase DDX54/DBP10